MNTMHFISLKGRAACILQKAAKNRLNAERIFFCILITLSRECTRVCVCVFGILNIYTDTDNMLVVENANSVVSIEMSMGHVLIETQTWRKNSVSGTTLRSLGIRACIGDECFAFMHESWCIRDTYTDGLRHENRLFCIKQTAYVTWNFAMKRFVFRGLSNKRPIFTTYSVNVTFWHF